MAIWLQQEGIIKKKKDDCNFLPEDVRAWEILKAIKKIYDDCVDYYGNFDPEDIGELYFQLKKEFTNELGERWLNEYIENNRD